MIYKQYISIQYLIVAQLFISFSLHAAVVLTGSASTDLNVTFTFPIQQNISSPEGQMFYTAAHPTLGNPGTYAVSVVTLDGTQFIPLAPELVTLNNVDGLANPLFNQNISFLGLLSGKQDARSLRIEHPIVVTSNDLTSVYIIDTFYSNKRSVESVIGVKDVAGATTSGIVGIGNMSNVYAVAAVKANGGSFGAPDSGLAVLLLTSQTTTDEKTSSSTTKRILSQIVTLPVNLSSPYLMIQNSLSSMNDVAAMHWDEKLKRLYVGFEVDAGGASGDGARAIAVMSDLSGSVFQVAQIAPSTIFTDGLQREIVGGINPCACVSIHGLKTMLTSTNFNYLIVQGGNGSPSQTRQIVSAVPLVNDPSSPSIHGTVADKTQIPNPLFGGFTIPATAPDQMTLDTDPAAQVGGGLLAAGSITDIFVRGDTVFATVFEPDVNPVAGVFYSQAIFNANGAIKAWTSWARVAGTIDQTTNAIDKVYGATFDAHGDFTMITGTGVDALYTVKRTKWGTDDKDGLLGGTKESAAVGLVQMMSSLFPANQAGLQGLVDLQPATPGLTNISLMIATGLNQVSLIETGTVSAGALYFNYGDFLTDSASFSGGAITQNLPIGGGKTKVVTLSGGVLNNIGPVTCAEIAADTNDNAWLAVGGAGGLAMLTKANGQGWSSSIGLGPNFDGLVNGMYFAPVGTYSYVRKLLCDNGLLYVLSDKQLDVIDLDMSDFAAGSIASHTLATLPDIGLTDKDTFIDFIVSDKFALLATSKGLWRVGDSHNIRFAQSTQDVGWTFLALPESVGPATQLFPITASGRSQDFAIGQGSNVYVLNAYVGSNSAQLARYTVNSVASSSVSPFTIEQIANSYFGQSIQAPLVFYPGFRDIFATDGAAFFNARSRNLYDEPFVNMVVGMLRGSVSNNSGTYTVPLDISTASHLTSMVRNYAMGCWMVAGDFGLRVNE